MAKRSLNLRECPVSEAAIGLDLAINEAHASPSMNKLAALDVLNRQEHGLYLGDRSH